MKDLVEYSIKVAPMGALAIVTQCAHDGQHFFRDFFACGFANTVSETPELFRAFFRELLADNLGGHAQEVLKHFLAGLSPQNHAAFFNPQAVSDKDHPTAKIHHRASFRTETGEAYADLLEVLINAGLQGSALRSFIFDKHNRRSDFERACWTRHVAYLKLVMPHVTGLREVFVRELLENAETGPAVIECLVRRFNLSLDTFTNDEVYWAACPKVRNQLWALRSQPR